MIDVTLMNHLLKAIGPGTKLILAGDKDQLPSVGAGNVLKDMIQSEAVAVKKLTKIYRQAAMSDIVVGAHMINQGQYPVFNQKDTDLFFMKRKVKDDVIRTMVEVILKRMPKFAQCSPVDDIQVLTPMRKGSLGIERLNPILQEYLNPPAPGKREHAVGEMLYREGDKVMQIKNNYQLEWEIVSKYGIPIDRGQGVFNGDMGRIVEIQEAASSLVVEYDEHRRVTYPFALLEELELSYAITIHKSQGSEYPAVIMPLLGGPRMLFNRNLLYTGVTRARNCVTILGSSTVVREMIDNESENRRFTALAERIGELTAEVDADSLW
jgi:exodeoxyribonuclease V alpha subunit